MKTIRNCKVSFSFRCPKDWETLNVTDEAKVRFCDQCRESVVYCETDAETIENALAGRCIARPEPAGSSGIRIGRPSIQEMREDVLNRHRIRRERAIDEAIKLEDFELCAKCGYPKSRDVLRCEICRCG